MVMVAERDRAEIRSLNGNAKTSNGVMRFSLIPTDDAGVLPYEIEILLTSGRSLATLSAELQGLNILLDSDYNSLSLLIPLGGSLPDAGKCFDTSFRIEKVSLISCLAANYGGIASPSEKIIPYHEPCWGATEHASFILNPRLEESKIAIGVAVQSLAFEKE